MPCPYPEMNGNPMKITTILLLLPAFLCAQEFEFAQEWDSIGVEISNYQLAMQTPVLRSAISMEIMISTVSSVTWMVVLPIIKTMAQLPCLATIWSMKISRRFRDSPIRFRFLLIWTMMMISTFFAILEIARLDFTKMWDHRHPWNLCFQATLYSMRWEN